ncbi:MAG: hypothetical protein RMX97_14230 [Nostoc sp. DedQUE11]|nr:hypothetical protein [Nostoc sp. DedQUE11]
MKLQKYNKFATLLSVGWMLSNFAAAYAADNLQIADTWSNNTRNPNLLNLAANPIPQPKLVFIGTEPYTVSGKNFQRYKLSVANWNAFPNNLFAKAPNLPPCGQNNNSSRTWVNIYNGQTNQRIYGFCAFSSAENLSSLWFAVEQGETPPQSVYIILKDRRTNKEYRSNLLSLTPETQAVKEDCIAFNPNNTSVNQVSDRWKIVENGNHWMFDFGNKKHEATRAFKIINHYGINKSCFVGRPQPSFQYLLVNNSAPSGLLQGEDCISFNPATTTVNQINNRWKIVDGNHWMFDFGNNKSEATTSLAIIKKYNFTHSCFVGRPDPSFTYLRR